MAQLGYNNTMNFLGKLNSIPDGLLEFASPVSFSIEHYATYENHPTLITLNVIVLHEANQIYTLISQDELPAGIDAQNLENLVMVANKIGQEVICLTEPLELETVNIPKPWGQEIWYSGIEQRGISTVKGLPLPWLLHVFGDYLGCAGAPLLLKILDPFPDTNLGDLYFEMHEKKTEVYVVTQIDLNAWPSGFGKIRYGFNQDLLNTFGSPKNFTDSYRLSVAEYQAIRIKIDARINSLKKKKGFITKDPLTPDEYNQFLGQIEAELILKEEKLRKKMYSYTAMHDLKVGDVVTVAPMIPHSLQHGVRVVEFQTPHYERHILSFGQEVLTQDHWDTEKALQKAITQDIASQEPEEIARGKDLIANFNAFKVIRLRLNPGESDFIERNNYKILIGVIGEITLNNSTKIHAEKAFFLASNSTIHLNNSGSAPAIVLIAEENHSPL